MDTILPHTHIRALRDWLEHLRDWLEHLRGPGSLQADKSVIVRKGVKFCNFCLHAPDNHSQAQPISAPFSEDDEETSSCFVEFKSGLYQIYWENSIQYPKLDRFPLLEGRCRPVDLSPSMEKIFASSTTINYGVDGYIRCSHNGPLPILKIAHPRPVSRARLQHEIEMLQEMKRHQIPVPLFDPTPLVDTEGIYGYRMEKLSPLDFNDLGAVSMELRQIVARMHDCGYSHGDLTPSNVMRDGNGSVVLIDPSFSGRLGEPTPTHIPSWQYEGSVFCTTTDDRYLQQFFGSA